VLVGLKVLMLSPPMLIHIFFNVYKNTKKKLYILGALKSGPQIEELMIKD
jgi:hypothetical protein